MMVSFLSPPQVKMSFILRRNEESQLVDIKISCLLQVSHQNFYVPCLYYIKTRLLKPQSNHFILSKALLTFFFIASLLYQRYKAEAILTGSPKKNLSYSSCLEPKEEPMASHASLKSLILSSAFASFA